MKKILAILLPVAIILLSTACSTTIEVQLVYDETSAPVAEENKAAAADDSAAPAVWQAEQGMQTPSLA